MDQRQNMMREYENLGFNAEQPQEIRMGLEHGLSKEQVKMYADPRCYSNEMKDIREEFENDLAIVQICKMAKSSNDIYQEDEMTDEEEYSFSM